MAEKASRGRPGADGTDRQLAIRDAARAAFDELGFDGASIRDIAARAGVDPKLVLHYFKSKAQLFAASMVFPAQSKRAIEMLRVTPKKDWGRAFADMMMQPDGRVVLPPLLGVLRSATSDPKVAQTIREFYIRTSVGTALEEIGIDNAKTRAACLSPVLAGYVFADQILQIPIGDKKAVAVRRQIFAETVQTILTAKVDELETKKKK
jgi:AcrR family transcriptional regulator